MRDEDLRLQESYFARVGTGDFKHAAKIKQVTAQESRSFFGSARQSSNVTLFRFGLFRRITWVASRHYEGANTAGVRTTYMDWYLAQQAESLKTGQDQEQLPTETLDFLAAQGDPALLAVRYFEDARKNDYPDYNLLLRASRDAKGNPIQVNELQSLYADYESLLRSIHGPLISQLGSSAVAGS